MNPLLFRIGAGVVLALLALGLWLFLRRRRRVAQALGDPALLARLLGADLTRPPWLRIALVGAAGAALAIALADPRWGSGDEAALSSGGPVVLVIDVSNSMLVEDVSPSRLSWARAALSRVAERLGGAPIGIVVFAGRAYALAPPTRDAGAVDLYLDALDTRMVTQTGSALAGALRQSVGLLAAGDAEGGAVLIVSDGNTDEDAEDVAAAVGLARRAGIPVYALGVGTVAGGAVPDLDPVTGRRLGYKREDDGQVIVSRLGEDLLRAVAEDTGGEYLPASATAPTVLAERMRSRPGSGAAGGAERPARYAWFAALALGLLLAEGWVASGGMRPTAAEGGR